VTDLASDPSVIELKGQLARAYFFHDDAAKTLELADAVLEAAEHANLVPVIADTLITKGTALVMSGREREGLMLQRGGGDLALSAGLPQTALRAAINRTFAESFIDPAASLEATRAGITMAQRLGLKSMAAVLVGNAAATAARTGDWDAAIEDINALGEDLDNSLMILLLASKAWFASSRGTGAAELLARLEEMVRDEEDTSTRAQVLDVRAWNAFASGRGTEARSRWQEILDVTSAGATDIRAMMARSALWDRDAAGARQQLELMNAGGSYGRAIDASRAIIEAGIGALEGRPNEVLGQFRDALRTWEELGLPWDQALTALDMVLLLPAGMPARREAAALARPILARLGATPFLALLDTAVGTSGDGPEGALRGHGDATSAGTTAVTSPSAGIE
jgi:tetratricopeptide (TPR) repeat protein